MASGSRSTRKQFFTLEEAQAKMFAMDSDDEGLLSEEESDIDKELYDLDGNLKCFHHTRFACACFEEHCYQNVGICWFDRSSCDRNLYSSHEGKWRDILLVKLKE